jgi:hypothetical protein
LAEQDTEWGDVFMGWRVRRGSYLPLFLFFILLLDDTSWIFRLGGKFLPSHPCGRPGDAPSPPPLPPFSQLFIVDMVGLPPHRIL